MKSLLFPSCLALAVSAALADGVLISHTMPPAQLLHLDGTPVDGVSASASEDDRPVIFDIERDRNGFMTTVTARPQ